MPRPDNTKASQERTRAADEMPADPEAVIAWLLEKLEGNGNESRRPRAAL